MNPSLGSGYQAVMYRLILSELKLDIVTLRSNWPLMQPRPVTPRIGRSMKDEASDWSKGPHIMRPSLLISQASSVHILSVVSVFHEKLDPDVLWSSFKKSQP